LCDLTGGNACPIPQAGGVGLEHAPHFVAHRPETLQHFFIAAGGLGWIEKWPVVAVHLARENRARLIRIAANGDDGVHALAQKFLQMLRAMPGNINADFRHDLDGERMHMAGGIGAGALDIRQIAQSGAQNALAQMAATGVAGA